MARASILQIHGVPQSLFGSANFPHQFPHCLGIYTGSRWAGVQWIQHPQDVTNQTSWNQDEFGKTTSRYLTLDIHWYLWVVSSIRQCLQVLLPNSAQWWRFQPVRPGFHDCSISPRRSDMNITPLSHSSFATLYWSNIGELISFLEPSEQWLL